MTNTHPALDAKHQRLALDWVLRSPALIAPKNTLFQTVPVISKQEIDRTRHYARIHLSNHLKQTKSHFLGPLFESYWHFYLCYSERYDLIDRNIQFNIDGKTFGEIDFLVYDKSEQVFKQQEVAIKFYLEAPEHQPTKALTSNPTLKHYERWVGPNSIDRLDLKLDKLLKHQLQLWQHAEIKKALRKHGIGDLKSEVLLKGMLFKHADTKSSSQLGDGELNPTHLSGVWYHIDAFTQELKCSDHSKRYVILSKPMWMALKKTHAQSEKDLVNISVSTEQLINYLSDRHGDNRAVMLNEFESIDSDHYIETRRIILVPNSWPVASRDS